MRAVVGAFGGLAALGLLIGGFGCTGSIVDAGGGAGAAGDSPVGAGGNAGGGGSGFLGEDPVEGGSSCNSAAAPGTRVVRLTHAQYDRTVQDLLHLEVTPSQAFLPDATFSGYDNNAEGLRVQDRLARDYRRAAEELSVQAMGDATARAALITCDAVADAEGCARSSIAALGRRAFRRPLDDAELDRFVALHGMGAQLVGGADPFRDGVQLVLEAMLQSPKFLYRVELSSEADDNGFIALSDHEVATRLSYMIWNTMPDERLLDAADAGMLHTPEVVAVEAERMLTDPRAQSVLDDFARQWLDFARYDDLLKDEVAYPDFDPAISASMKEEVRRFLRHVVYGTEGHFADLYTLPVSFVDEALAPYYGLPAPGSSDFEQVSLPEGERGGLLTQIGFLASHAYFDRTSPIHRGVFVHRRILCSHLPDPPGDVDLTLPPIEGEIKTTRQQVEVHTSPDACQGCHGVINPVGFAFENFDSLGRARADESGEPLDTTGMVALDGSLVSFSGAKELRDAIGASIQARECYATQWLRYAYGRAETPGDACTVERLAERLGEADYPVRRLLVDLTQTRSFMQRTAEASP